MADGMYVMDGQGAQRRLQVKNVQHLVEAFLHEKYSAPALQALLKILPTVPDDLGRDLAGERRSSWSVLPQDLGSLHYFR